MNMTGEHLGGDHQTDNHVTGFVPDRLIAWKSAPADVDPPGWKLGVGARAAGPRRHRRHAHLRRGKVEDKILELITDPLVTKHQLDESSATLSEAVSG